MPNNMTTSAARELAKSLQETNGYTAAIALITSALKRYGQEQYNEAISNAVRKIESFDMPSTWKFMASDCIRNLKEPQ